MAEDLQGTEEPVIVAIGENVVASLTEAQFERLVRALANGMTPGEAERWVGAVAADVEQVAPPEDASDAALAAEEPASAEA